MRKLILQSGGRDIIESMGYFAFGIILLLVVILIASSIFETKSKVRYLKEQVMYAKIQARLIARLCEKSGVTKDEIQSIVYEAEDLYKK